MSAPEEAAEERTFVDSIRWASEYMPPDGTISIDMRCRGSYVHLSGSFADLLALIESREATP